jgi:hypothetical protein
MRSAHKEQLCLYTKKCMVSLDFGAVEFLQHEPKKTKREFIEMLHIYNNNTMNIKTDVAGISNTYKSFLKTLNNKKLV